MHFFRGLTIFLGLISVLSTPYVQAESYCGAGIGYNLTNAWLTDLTGAWDNYGTYISINICRRVSDPTCAGVSYVGCIGAYGVASVPFGPQPTSPWSYIDPVNPSRGVTWTSIPTLETNTPSLRTLKVNLTCNPQATSLIGLGWSYQEDYSVRPANVTHTYRAETNLVCGNPIFPPPSSMPSSTGLGLSFPSSSTGSSNTNLTTCGVLQPWYFSYFGLVSPSYTISFYGTFYTATGLPSEIRFLQVLQIQATWVLTINGVSTRTSVTNLNLGALNMINVNGGMLYPLQGQSLSFYVGTELVTIGGSGIYPVILNSSTAVQTGVFAYSSVSQDIRPSVC